MTRIRKGHTITNNGAHSLVAATPSGEENAEEPPSRLSCETTVAVVSKFLYNYLWISNEGIILRSMQSRICSRTYSWTAASAFTRSTPLICFEIVVHKEVQRIFAKHHPPHSLPHWTKLEHFVSKLRQVH